MVDGQNSCLSVCRVGGGLGPPSSVVMKHGPRVKRPGCQPGEAVRELPTSTVILSNVTQRKARITCSDFGEFLK